MLTSQIYSFKNEKSTINLIIVHKVAVDGVAMVVVVVVVVKGLGRGW